MRLVLLPVLVGTLLTVQPSAPAKALAADLVAHYDAHDYDRFTADFGRVTSFADISSALFDRATPLKLAILNTQRRRLVLAAVSLELVARYGVANRTNALMLLWKMDELVRLSRPGPIEQTWYWADVAMLEALGDGGQVELHAEHGLARFPGDPHLVLARAIGAELRTFPEPRGVTLKDDPDNATLAISRFKQALAYDAIRAEANLRIGVTLVRLDRARDALPYLARVKDATTDPYLLYLSALFTGRAAEQLHRMDDAIQSYREACRIVPGQAAAFGLATALARAGQRAEAARVSEQFVTMPSATGDPWTAYGSADARFLESILTSLREALR